MPTHEYKFLKTNKVSAIGIPLSAGQPHKGVEKGPRSMMEFGLANQLQELGWEVEYHDNEERVAQLKPEHDPVLQNLKNPKTVSAVTKDLSQQVAAAAKQGNFVLTLGGDHSLGLASVSGIFEAYPDACLIWVDAHADINTPSATTSGNIHGCPLAFLAGLSNDHPDFQWVKPCLKLNRLAYIGLRDVDDFERKVIRDMGITAFTMQHINKYGIGKVLDMALDAINPGRDRPIHVSFDVDALDPTVAPATGTPVQEGMTLREGHFICETLAESGLLVALDVVEVNPELSNEEDAFRTIQVGCSVARWCLGETLL